MALNFPANPEPGNQYLGSNGVTYTYDGVKWVGASVEIGSGFPTASTTTAGVVKVDGTSITIANGVISSQGGGGGNTFNQSLNTTDDVTFDSVGTAAISVSQINGTNPGNELVIQANNHNWTFGTNGDLALPVNGGLVFDRANTSIRVGMGFHIASGEGIDIQAIDETDPNNLLYKNWYFSPLGTLTVPSPTSTPFPLVFSSANYVPTVGKPVLTLTDTPWALNGQYAYAPDGRSALALDNIWPTVTNPGYESGDAFTFDSSVHGISGFILTITLNSVVLAGPAGWTANVSESVPPVYQSTIESNGAIKLTANTNSLILGTDGTVTVSGAIEQGNSKLDLNENNNGNVYLTTTINDSTAMFMTPTSIQTYATESVSLQAGAGLAALETAYNNKVIELDAAFAADLWTGAGYPAGPTSSQALNAAKAMNPLIPDAWITIASELQAAYDAWQTALSDTGVGITVGNNTWAFTPDGILTLPSGNTTIGNTLGSDAIISAPDTTFGVVSQGAAGVGVLQWLDSIVTPTASAGIVVNSPYAVTPGSVQIYTGSVGIPPQNAWTFGTDGSLALPTVGKISNGASTPQVGSNLVIATNDGGGLTGWSSTALAVVYNADIISTYAIGSTITWQDGTTATITGIDNYAPTYIDIFWDTPKTGDLFPITLKTSNYVAAVIAPQWTFGADSKLTIPGSLTFPNSTVQTTAYPGINTVAKTGSGVPGTGEVATITLNPTNNTNFVPGTYYGIFLGIGSGFNMTFDVAVNGDLTATIVSSNGGFVGGETGSLNGVAIAGGTTGVDDIGVTVATLTNIATPTALDLTKQVQKLTDGYYTLANGVEGQVMHLVRQTGATVSITVIVANARVAGAQYTTIEHYPFTTGDMNMLIFTDGAWQAMGGTWD